MSQPSLIDLETPFDPTTYTSISGPQLEQLVGGTTPYTDKGLIMVTTDVAGVAQVPAANITPKWQNYIWLRIQPTAITAYAWNAGGSADPTLLQWQSITQASIGNGAITDSMIATNTISADKINSVAFGSITGLPPGLTPTGVSPTGTAGGVLAGTYPNPSLSAGAVTTASIAANAITHALLGANAVQPTTDMQTDGVANDMLIVDPNNLTNFKFVSPPPILVKSGGGSGFETNIATSPLKNLQVNAAGTGYQYGALSVLKESFYISYTPATANRVLALTGTAPATTIMDLLPIFGTSGVMTFTPVSSNSTLMFEVNLMGSIANDNSYGNGTLVVAVFEGTTCRFAGVCTQNYVFNFYMTGNLTGNVAGTGRTFAVYVAASSGSSGPWYINSETGTAFLGGGVVNSSVRIREILSPVNN